MEHLPRIPLAERVAEVLCGEIRDGRLRGELPGQRALCRKLGISRTALEPAVAKLVADGWLVSPGLKRRYRILSPEAGVEKPERRRRRLLLLEPNKHGVGTPLVMRVADALRARLRDRGWQVDTWVAKVDQAKTSAAYWDTVLAGAAPDRLLLVAGHRPTVEWAMQCGVPVDYFGGDTWSMAARTVAYDSSTMIEIAVNAVVARGHRQVFLPLRHLATPHLRERILLAYRNALERAGIAFGPRWHLAEATADSPGAIYDLVEARFRHSPPPSVILAHGSHGLMEVLGFLLHHRLAVPEDVSLVYVGDHRDLPGMFPPLDSFDFPIAPVLRCLEKWILGEARENREERKMVMPRFRSGKSVAECGRLPP